MSTLPFPAPFVSRMTWNNTPRRYSETLSMRLAPSSSPSSSPHMLGPPPQLALLLVSSLQPVPLCSWIVSEVIQLIAPNSMMHSLSRELGFWIPKCWADKLGDRWSGWDSQCPGCIWVPWDMDSSDDCQYSGQCQGHIVSCAVFFVFCCPVFFMFFGPFTLQKTKKKIKTIKN